MESNWALMEDRFALMYHLGWTNQQCNELFDTFLVEKKVSLKNYWLQKKEIKDQVKEHDNKLDEIARFVTKYISSRKKDNR